MLRFRRFRTLLLLVFASLVALVQGISFLFVSQLNRRDAQDRILADLELGASRFHRLIADRMRERSVWARLLLGDHALRQVLAADDRPTLASALRSYQARIGAAHLLLLDPSHAPMAATDPTLSQTDWAAFGTLAARAEQDERDEPSATGYALIHDSLHALLVVPVFAPRPQIVAWLGIALHIDAPFAQELKRQSRLDITFLRRASDAATSLAVPPAAPLASTLPSTHIGEAMTALIDRASSSAASSSTTPIDASSSADEPLLIAGERFLVHASPLPLVGGGSVLLALQRSLDQELAPTRHLERLLLTGAAGSLLLAVLLAVALARAVSSPVQRLADHTRRVAAGDYATRLPVVRRDEFGALAQAFNSMSEGLAERDRVRDLLDKNVSPEVAARLLRDGAALGGEEREVTVLFADIRGFTTLSERLPPQALVALLNRFFERASRAVEGERGIIDKYIGDAVMALFGAPLALDNAPDCALRAACALRSAVAALNDELAREGHPPLGIGVGVNTARVVAGNIGSSRRLNYSVIGDGVNVAARLQSLTRVPEHAADVLLSESTRCALKHPWPLRSIGPQSVKGRTQAIPVYALEQDVNAAKTTA